MKPKMDVEEKFDIQSWSTSLSSATGHRPWGRSRCGVEIEIKTRLSSHLKWNASFVILLTLPTLCKQFIVRYIVSRFKHLVCTIYVRNKLKLTDKITWNIEIHQLCYLDLILLTVQGPHLVTASWIQAERSRPMTARSTHFAHSLTPPLFLHVQTAWATVPTSSRRDELENVLVECHCFVVSLCTDCLSHSPYFLSEGRIRKCACRMPLFCCFSMYRLLEPQSVLPLGGTNQKMCL
jgi:hypothetical protein